MSTCVVFRVSCENPGPPRVQPFGACQSDELAIEACEHIAEYDSADMSGEAGYAGDERKIAFWDPEDDAVPQPAGRYLEWAACQNAVDSVLVDNGRSYDRGILARIDLRGSADETEADGTRRVLRYYSAYFVQRTVGQFLDTFTEADRVVCNDPDWCLQAPDYGPVKR